MARKVREMGTVAGDGERITLSEEEFQVLTAQANAARDAGLAVDPDDDVEHPDELLALREMDGASETKWQIFRTLPHDKAGFVGTLATSQLQLEFIGRRYGAGKYRIKGIRSNGTYAAHRTIEIAESTDFPPGGVSPSTPAVTAPGNGGIADYLALQTAERERSKDNAFKWAGLIVPALAPFLPKIVETMFGGGTKLKDLTEALANMKAMAGGDKDQLTRVEEFARIVEVVKGIGGDEKSPTGKTVYDLVDSAISGLTPILGGLLAGRAGAPGTAPALPRPQIPAPAAGAPKPAEPAPTAPVENPMMALLNWLGAQMEGLVSRAAKDSDPELYADVMADNLPENVNPLEIRGFLARADWWAMLSAWYKPAAPYQGWFTALRNRLIEIIDENVKPTPASRAPGGAAPIEQPTGEQVSNE